MTVRAVYSAQGEGRTETRTKRLPAWKAARRGEVSRRQRAMKQKRPLACLQHDRVYDMTGSTTYKGMKRHVLRTDMYYRPTGQKCRGTCHSFDVLAANTGCQSGRAAQEAIRNEQDIRARRRKSGFRWHKCILGRFAVSWATPVSCLETKNDISFSRLVPRRSRAKRRERRRMRRV